MITEGKRWLGWDPEDVPVVTRVIGPEEASKEKAPILASVLKGVKAGGCLLEPELDRMLLDERHLRTELKRLRKQEDSTPPEYYPKHLVDKLFPHQRVALDYLSRGLPAYLLRDQPGVGKTAVAIMWAEARMAKKVLVVTPTSAKDQWAREIGRWTVDEHPVHIFPSGRRRLKVRSKSGKLKRIGKIAYQNRLAKRDGWIISHWEGLVNADALIEQDWDVVILDEGHAIRNRDTRRALAAFALNVPNRLVLTAHPFVNSPDELWSILHFLYPEDYSSFWRFWSMHVLANPKYFGGYDIMGSRDPQLLKWELAPFALGRTKQQVFKSLPPVNRIPRYVELEGKHLTEYKKIQKEFFVQLEVEAAKPRDRDVDWAPTFGMQWLTIPTVLARITRLRQYLVDPGLLGAAAPSLKYPVVAELLDELDGPPVIFTMFKEAAVRLGEYLKKEHGRKVGYIHGEIDNRGRAKSQKRFLDGKLDALIVTTQAGGEALNLGKYGYVIYLDLPFTPKDLEQTEGRVDRPEEGTGKLVPTTSYRIIVKGTYEEKLEQKLEKKKGMFDEVFGAQQVAALFT